MSGEQTGEAVDAVTLRVLEAVERNDIGFRYEGSRTTLHWWLSEHEKRVLTKAERARLFDLLAIGAITAEHAVGAFGRGAYYLAGVGHVTLRRHRDSTTPPTGEPS